MEEKQVKIWQSTGNGEEKVGSVVFHENVTAIELQRTATNVNLKIPSEIRLTWKDKDKMRPMLTNIRVLIYLKDSTGGRLEVGMARDDEHRMASTSPESILKTELIWRDSLAGLIYIEKNRTGVSPALEFELQAELCFVVRCKEWWSSKSGQIRLEDPPADVVTPPFQRVRGKVELSYPADVWSRMIQTAFEASQDNPLLVLQSLLPFLAGNKT